MMFRRPRLAASLLAAATLVAFTGLAGAQDYPPGSVGGGYEGGENRSICIRLESQLAAFDSGSRGGQADVGAVLARQQKDVADLSAQVRQIGCDKRGFLIFQPQLPPQCDSLNRRLQQARSALDRTMMQARSQQSGNDEQRRQLIYALAQNNCGAQYQAALGQGGGGGGVYGNMNRRPRNFIEQLFGVPREEAGPLDVQPLEMPKVSTYRTVCVRTCDGFFFPISFAATPAKFGSDEAQCQRQCPGTEARLFAYRNPGEDINQAVAINGQPYMSLPTALLYKKQFVAACTCRPAGMSWAQALGGQEDQTLRKGDIIVTEDASREMAQPRPATVPTSKKP